MHLIPFYISISLRISPPPPSRCCGLRWPEKHPIAGGPLPHCTHPASTESNNRYYSVLTPPSLLPSSCQFDAVRPRTSGVYTTARRVLGNEETNSVLSNSESTPESNLSFLFRTTSSEWKFSPCYSPTSAHSLASKEPPSRFTNRQRIQIRSLPFSSARGHISPFCSFGMRCYRHSLYEGMFSLIR